jgi:CubicO group peptidase (beta-lactamase class C family)
MSRLSLEYLNRCKIDAFSGMSFLERMHYYHIPAASIAVVNNGRLDSTIAIRSPHISECQNASENHVFQAASISKPVFAVAVMRLYEEGLIDIDTDVNQYLKDFKAVDKDSQTVPVTLRQILGHVGGFNVHGFPGYKPGINIPSIYQVLQGEGLSPKVIVDLTPGTICRYSGGGITVAQKAVSDHIGLDFNDMISKYVFQPLSMTRSTFSQPLTADRLESSLYGYYDDYVPVEGGFRVFPELAAAGLWSTPSDLALLGMEMQKALDGQSSFISKVTAKTMVTPQKVTDCHYGIGFGADDSYFGHTGSHDGYACLMRFSKKGHHGMVVMLNSSEGVQFRFEVFKALAQLYEW